jgi:5-formyltetrahydrofolate cyclo-ligase
MKNIRRSLSCDDIREKSNKVFENILKSGKLAKAKNICVYMNAFNEVDTSDIIKYCLDVGKEVFVPVVDGDNIYICKYEESTEKGAFGISEPVNKVKKNTDEIDVFIIPGLAFSVRGGRVGFGKGYYDKLLNNTTGIRIGILYNFQLVENIENESHDILMNWLITESKVIKCEV